MAACTLEKSRALEAADWIPQQFQSGTGSLENSWRVIGLQSTLEGQRSWISLLVKDGSGSSSSKVDAVTGKENSQQAK